MRVTEMLCVNRNPRFKEIEDGEKNYIYYYLRVALRSFVRLLYGVR